MTSDILRKCLIAFFKEYSEYEKIDLQTIENFFLKFFDYSPNYNRFYLFKKIILNFLDQETGQVFILNWKKIKQEFPEIKLKTKD